MSHCSTPNGSASSYIEDHQVGVINWLQGESQQTTDVKTKVNAAEVPEKNRNLINQERQQKQVRSNLLPCRWCWAYSLMPNCFQLCGKALDCVSFQNLYMCTSSL